MATKTLKEIMQEMRKTEAGRKIIEEYEGEERRLKERTQKALGALQKKLSITDLGLGDKPTMPWLSGSPKFTRTEKALQVILFQATKDLWFKKWQGPHDTENLIEYYIMLFRWKRIAPENVLPYLRTHIKTAVGRPWAKNEPPTEAQLKKWFAMERVTTLVASKIFCRDIREVQRWIKSGQLKRDAHGYVKVIDLYNFAKSFNNMDKFEHVWRNYERLVKRKAAPVMRPTQMKKSTPAARVASSARLVKPKIKTLHPKQKR